MDSSSWRRILESIRPEDQSSLLVRTVDLVEVAVESLARIEDEVVLVKGRLSGAPDGRRLFLLPYDKLSCLYVNRIVANDEIDLFSPSVGKEEKERIAARIADRTRVADEESQYANGKQSPADQDVKSQFEELRRLANLPANAPPAGPRPSERSEPKSVSGDAATKTLAIPAPPERRPKFTLPEPPRAR